MVLNKVYAARQQMWKFLLVMGVGAYFDHSMIFHTDALAETIRQGFNQLNNFW